MSNCIFCKIISGEIPKEFVFQDTDVVAFSDIHPVAPVHILIIPKMHIPTVADTKKDDALLMGKLIMTAKKIAEDKGIADNGYKLLMRVRKHGEQEVDHIHLHLIGGAQLQERICPAE